MLRRAPLFLMGFAGPAYQSGVLPSVSTMEFKWRKVGNVLLGKFRASHKLEDPVVPQGGLSSSVLVLSATFL